MTDIERIVYYWLIKHEISFMFQSSIAGGYFSLGGAVVDFVIKDGNLAWRIFGEYWHQGIAKEAEDIIQRELLMDMGYTVVDIWGEDIKGRLDSTMLLALQGIEQRREG